MRTVCANASWRNIRRLRGTEARRLEEQIQKLVQIYAEGRILLQGDPSDRIRRDLRLQGKEQTQDIDITDNY